MERILICGAGVSGSVLAFWLAKHGFEVVVVERSRSDQKAGQGIEIEEPALAIVKEMGIMDQLKEIRTGEEGFILFDEENHTHAEFGIDGIGVTGALEMMRGDLVEVLYRAADKSPNVTYHFETTIRSLKQSDKVHVELESKSQIRTEEFDLVVGADGLRSKTRQLSMGTPEELDCYKPVGACIAYFSIPKEDGDWPYSKLCNFQDRRVVWIRPARKDSKTSCVHLIYLKDKVPEMDEAVGNRMKQKEIFAKIFKGLGWETPRVIDGMMKTDNFYSEELVQVKLDKWSQGRVVLVGDAAWAPTPFTGQGNQLAIIGAWVLAQELSRDRSLGALETYEKRLRAYVASCQDIPLFGYAPWLVIPKTSYGIWFFRKVLKLISMASRSALGTMIAGRESKYQESLFDLQIK
jgi:2-polyprenyl-6-methoxyphenol hydroxylase-like FAD-dependent oxidoreductase